jgi:hypothetical protein
MGDGAIVDFPKNSSTRPDAGSDRGISRFMRELKALGFTPDA